MNDEIGAFGTEYLSEYEGSRYGCALGCGDFPGRIIIRGGTYDPISF